MELEKLQLICHVLLLDANTNDIQTTINTLGAKKMRNRNGIEEQLDSATTNMSGQKTATPLFLCDPLEQQEKLFFVFHDLCIRVKGEYKLKCIIMDMNRYLLLTRSCTVLQELMTSCFEVYSVQYFPGIPEPTALSDSFLKQGLYEFDAGVRTNSGRRNGSVLRNKYDSGSACWHSIHSKDILLAEDDIFESSTNIIMYPKKK
jgi:hypothetical protein